MISIGQRLDTIEDEPIDHLIACHDRILARLVTLERIRSGLHTDPKAALTALRNTLRFFDLSGRLHTEDEEYSVFPRLRARLTREQLTYLDNLESEHREKERVYADLRTLAGELDDEITDNRVQRYSALVSRLCGLYRSHIASENDVLVRLGRESLTEQERSEIHREMRARRR
ncbi:MAG TPA: hemerythrin domain-containing protein [Bryobacteraceae bacterium]|nr:hemerythrin domain-containing protein [Bryobacteraceae bacterium]